MREQQAAQLGDVVRAWVVRQYPGIPEVGERAAGVAERAYVGGATVRQACEEAQAFAGSWSRHPANQRWMAGAPYLKAS